MKKKINKPLLRNRKEKMIALFLGLIIITIVMGGAIIYEIAFYVPLDTNPILTSIIILSICLGISFIIHGFHPILLFKSNHEGIKLPIHLNQNGSKK